MVVVLLQSPRVTCALRAVYPQLDCQQRNVKVSYINSCTGLDLDAQQISRLLSRMALTAEASPGADSVHVEVPPSRSDILHDCDVMEVGRLNRMHAN